MNALEMALALKEQHGGKVSLLSMGPPLFDQYLRVALSMGADRAYLLSDQRFAGADTLATTYTLAKGIEKIGSVDLVFCGEESSDGATGQVPPGLAEWLGCSLISMVSEIRYDPNGETIQGQREIMGGYEVVEVPIPAVISVQTASNEPRFMDYEKKAWAFAEQDNQLTIWRPEDIGAEGEFIGFPGSPTVVSELKEAASRERKREFLEGTPEEIAKRLSELIRKSL